MEQLNDDSIYLNDRKVELKFSHILLKFLKATENWPLLPKRCKYLEKGWSLNMDTLTKVIKTKADRSVSTGKALQETDSWLRKTNNRRSKRQSRERNPDMTPNTLYPPSVSCSGPRDPRAWQQSHGVLWPVAAVGWREGLLRLLAPRGRHPLERQRQAGGGCAHQGER